MARLKTFIKSILLKRHVKKIGKYVKLSKDTIYENGFWVDIRYPVLNRCYLEIGNCCVIGSRFIFESEGGDIKVGSRVYIGGNTKLISKTGITIGNDVIIAWDCTIYDHNSHSVYWNERANDVPQIYENYCKHAQVLDDKNWDVVHSSQIVIKDKVWIGFGVTILKGVTIGEGAVVGACSVVTHDVEAYTVVAGNPAKVNRKLSRNS